MVSGVTVLIFIIAVVVGYYIIRIAVRDGIKDAYREIQHSKNGAINESPLDEDTNDNPN